MSELNTLDIISQACKIQHSAETSTFSLVSGDVYGCGHKALKITFFCSGSVEEFSPIVSIT